MKFMRLFALAAIALATTAHPSIGQGTYNHSAFEKAMEDAMKNLRVVMGSLIAGDWAKAEASAEALAGGAKTIRGLTPKASADRIGEFQARADSLAVQSARVAAAAKAHAQDVAGQGLGQIVQSCMGCHSTFRK